MFITNIVKNYIKIAENTVGYFYTYSSINSMAICNINNYNVLQVGMINAIEK